MARSGRKSKERRRGERAGKSDGERGRVERKRGRKVRERGGERRQGEWAGKEDRERGKREWVVREGREREGRKGGERGRVRGQGERAGRATPSHWASGTAGLWVAMRTRQRTQKHSKRVIAGIQRKEMLLRAGNNCLD